MLTASQHTLQTWPIVDVAVRRIAPCALVLLRQHDRAKDLRLLRRVGDDEEAREAVATIVQALREVPPARYTDHARWSLEEVCKAVERPRYATQGVELAVAYCQVAAQSNVDVAAEHGWTSMRLAAANVLAELLAIHAHPGVL